MRADDNAIAVFGGINVVRLKPEHVLSIEPQPEQADFIENMPPNWIELLHLCGDSWTIQDDDGNIVSICGTLPIKGEAVTWAVHSNLFKNHVIDATRAYRAFIQSLLDSGQYTKVITYVTTKFAAGHAWAKLLKFKLNQDRHDFGFGQSIYERTA